MSLYRPATHPPVVLHTLEATSLVAEGNDERSDEEEVDESGSSTVINEDCTLMENSEVEVTEAQMVGLACQQHQ